jgi:cytochrome c-type biogenesis protein CcmE
MAGMKSLKKQRRIQIIVIAFVALFGAAFAFWMAAPGAFQYFRSPTQIVDHPPPPNEVFRLGGLVTKGSLKRGQGKTVHFEVTDTHATVPVVFTGILPDLFGEGQGMVGTGSWVNGEFVATQILAKHDANYMPKEVIDALKAQGVYVAPNGTTPGS